MTHKLTNASFKTLARMTSNNQTAPSNPTIFVDLGGIFVHYPADHALKTGDTALPLGRLLSSSPWMDYEVGKLTEQECFARVADLFGVDAKDLEAVVLKLRATLPFASRMFSVFRAVKETPGVKVKVVLTTNISQEEYRALRGRWDEAFWSIFDHVVTSGEVGVRKPSLQFYRHALRVAGSSPQHSLVVDDRPENVLAAMSLGMRGHVGTDSIARVLANFVGDPVERGLAFLRKNAGKLYSTTEDGDPIEENYAQLLVLEALNDRYCTIPPLPSPPSFRFLTVVLSIRTLVDLQRPPGLWNFFSGKPKYTSQRYPDDFDTTSLALVAMEYEPEAAHPILDEMLKHVNEDGLVPVSSEPLVVLL